MKIKKYDVVYINNYNAAKGSVQDGPRPGLVIQNNVGNHFSPTVIVALLTSQIKREDLPTHVVLDNYMNFRKSMVLLEQITTVSKESIDSKIGSLRPEDRRKVDTALAVSLGFFDGERE